MLLASIGYTNGHKLNSLKSINLATLSFFISDCNFAFACDLRPLIITLGNVYKIITYIKLFPYQIKVEALDISNKSLMF